MLPLIRITSEISFAITLPIAMLCGVILYLICFALSFRRYGVRTNLCLAALFIYAAAVLQLTQTFSPPQTWQFSAASAQRVISSIEWVPFRSSAVLYRNGLSTGNLSAFIRGVGGNFILLTPLGILLPLLDPVFELRRITAAAVLVPIGIETLQFLSNLLSGSAVRNVQTEDVLLNAAGCLLAYALFSAARDLAEPRHPARHLRRRRHLRGREPA